MRVEFFYKYANKIYVVNNNLYNFDADGKMVLLKNGVKSVVCSGDGIVDENNNYIDANDTLHIASNVSSNIAGVVDGLTGVKYYHYDSYRYSSTINQRQELLLMNDKTMKYWFSCGAASTSGTVNDVIWAKMVRCSGYNGGYGSSVGNVIYSTFVVYRTDDYTINLIMLGSHKYSSTATIDATTTKTYTYDKKIVKVNAYGDYDTSSYQHCFNMVVVFEDGTVDYVVYNTYSVPRNTVYAPVTPTELTKTNAFNAIREKIISLTNIKNAVVNTSETSNSKAVPTAYVLFNDGSTKAYYAVYDTSATPVVSELTPALSTNVKDIMRMTGTSYLYYMMKNGVVYVFPYGVTYVTLINSYSIIGYIDISALVYTVIPLSNSKDLKQFNAIEVQGVQPENTNRMFAFKIGDTWCKLNSDGTSIPLSTQDVSADVVLAEGNTAEELTALTNVPAFVNADIYPAIALFAEGGSDNTPSAGMTFDGISAEVKTRTLYSSVIELGGLTIADICFDVSGQATAKARIKQDGAWSNYGSLELVKGQQAQAVQLAFECTVDTPKADKVTVNNIVVKVQKG